MAIKKKKKSKRPLKKKVVRKKPLKKTIKKKAATPKIEGKVIGKITHYFPQVRAGVIKLKGPLTLGEMVKIKGHTTDLTQTVTSMQIDRASITAAKKGQEIGLLVNARVRRRDVVYKI